MHTILVTGANKGIGLEIAKQYCEDGWQVFACCRNPGKAKQLQILEQSSQKRLQIFELEVTDPQSIKKLAASIGKTPIDVFINNAGVWGPQNINFGAVHEVTTEWLTVFKVNTIAPLILAETFIENIASSTLKQIIHMSSDMASIALNIYGGEYLYRSSKSALNAVAKSMAIDLKKRDITVVALEPGWVKTEMGGPNAILPPEVSVKHIKQVLSALSIENTGSFMAYGGGEMAW